MTKVIRYDKWGPELEKALAQPFEPVLVGWKPQWVSKERDGGIAVPYVDPRHYYNRLDDLVGPEGWSAEPEIVNATTIIMRVTILGVSRYGIGEKAANDQNTLAAAEAQAFKRACAHGFNFGRYLYTHMEQVFVGMTPKGKSAAFSKDGVAKLRQAAVEQTAVYQNYLDGKSEPHYRDAMGPELPGEEGDEKPQRPAQPQPPRQETVPFVYPDNEGQETTATVGPPPPESEIAALNYSVAPKTKSGARSAPSKHTGITDRDIKLRELILAGEKGIKYIEWMAENWNVQSGKDAAQAVMDWVKAGNTLSPTPDPAANPVGAQPPTAPDTNVIDTSTYPGGITTMPELADAFGTHPGDAWSIIARAGIKSVPKPDEQEQWAMAWGAMVSEKGKPGGASTQPPFDQ